MHILYTYVTDVGMIRRWKGSMVLFSNNTTIGSLFMKKTNNSTYLAVHIQNLHLK